MMAKGRSRNVYLLFIVFLLFLGIVAQRFSSFDETDNMYRAFTGRIEIYLMKGLVFEHHLPRGDGGHRPDPSLVVYILGGRQESLRYQCKTVGRLYMEGATRKVLVLHRPGITEYSPALGRNFTNDEWATVTLKEEGVAIENVEFIPVAPALFGTFAEARVISGLARSRRVKRLVLVCSTHHTKRVWLSFSHFNVDNAFELYTYGSEERAGISEILVENLKLRMYRYIVFPLDRLRGHFRG
ncbi:MAG: hypothetical protein NCA08_05550 [Deltaproteobacteria bacterium]|nr:hypothetical protein [Candidatus Deferrimicrobium borealis]